MKRHVILLMVIAAMLAGCRKEGGPKNYKVAVTNEKVADIDPTRVEISGAYSYPSDLDAIYVLVGGSGDMADASAFESVLSGKNFTATVTGLRENTNYYYRYRFVSMGTEQESEAVKSFTTLDYRIPKVTTAEVTEITGCSVKCGGEVTYGGGYDVTERGVCWSTEPNPTVEGSHTTDGGGTGTFTSSITGLSPNTTYYVRAYATNSHGTGYGGQRSFRTSDPYNGHECVDLGLPSGTLWATCNVGADKPEDYGNYYAWGETTTKSTYSWSTYKWCNGSSSTLTKYCTSGSYGTVDNKTVLKPADDAAHVNWGGGWRMPTKAEMQELEDNCNRTWTTLNGVSGYRFANKSDNNKFIFLPAAGYYNDGSLNIAGSDGYYWSSSLYTDYPSGAYTLYFYSSSVYVDGGCRFYGLSVRPVLAPQK